MADLPTLSFGTGDPGLFTYPQIVHLLTVEFARARRYGYPLSCILFRIDRLASIGDVQGWVARDFVRERVVAAIRRESRACDFVGRFPDDRFLVVLPHTDEVGARTLADRVARSVSSLDFTVGERVLRATVSAGASCYRDRNTLFYDAVVYAAEQALLEAERSGGARVLVRDPKPRGFEPPAETEETF